MLVPANFAVMINEPFMPEEKVPEYCNGWIAGFAAAASLMSGNKPYYERERDDYLRRKGWTPPVDAKVKR